MRKRDFFCENKLLQMGMYIGTVKPSDCINLSQVLWNDSD